MHNQHPNTAEHYPFNNNNNFLTNPFNSPLPITNQNPQAYLHIAQSFNPHQIRQLHELPPTFNEQQSIPLPNNFTNYFSSPRNAQQQINPQSQQCVSSSKAKHLYDLNKSVKSIMKCNEQYREQLLSAYQHKSKIQIQNVILTKEKENLEAEKQTLEEQLQEANKKLVIAQNYNKRSVDNHKKVCQQLRKEIQRLNGELKSTTHLRFQLHNKSNENGLLLERNHRNQSTINQLTLRIQTLQGHKEQLIAKCSSLKQQLSDHQSLKNKLFTLNSQKQQQSQTYKKSLQQSSKQVNHLRQQLDALRHHYSHLSEKYQRQKGAHLSLQAQIYHQSHSLSAISEQLKVCKSKNKQLWQRIQTKEGQIGLLKAQMTQLISMRNANRCLSQSLNRKQQQLHNLAHLYAQITLQYTQISSQHSQLKDKMSRMESTHQQYEDRIQSIHSQYNQQMDKLIHQLQTELQQKERLNMILSKKDLLIHQKEALISKQINQILSLESCLEKQNHQFSAQIGHKDLTVIQLRQALTIVKKQLALNKQASEQTLANIGSQMEQKQFANKAITDKLITDNQKLKSEITLLQQQLKTSAQGNQAKQALVEQQKNQVGKLTKFNQSLKGQIQIVQKQYSILQSTLRTKIQQQRQAQQMLEAHKTESAKMIKKLVDKLSQQQVRNRHLQQQMVSLAYQTNVYKSGAEKQRVRSQTMHSLSKHILQLQQLVHQLQVDPKISIARFTSLINSSHRQPFTRQAQKLKAYLQTQQFLYKQMKLSLEQLKLNTNMLSFQFTFSPSKMPLNSQS